MDPHQLPQARSAQTFRRSIAMAVALAISFSIAMAPFPVDNSKGGPDIRVRKPNGGEVWVRGEKEKIRWRSTGFTGFNVRIELLRDGTIDREIAAVKPNDGKLNWAVPNDVPIGTGYAVRVISLADTYIRDKSKHTFSIIDVP